MRLFTSDIEPLLVSLNKVTFVIDERRMWQYLSPNWQQLTGFCVADTLGTSADDFLSFADCPVIQEVIGDLLAGIRQQARYVARCATAYGDIRYIELDMATQTAQGSRETVIVGLMHDVTERKKAEDALVRRERRIQHIVDNLPSMVSYLSPDLRVTFANAAYAAEFGKRVDEVIGMSLFDLLHPSLHDVARGHLTSLNQHTPQYVFEHWVVRANGEWRFQRWTDHAFFDEHGQISEYQSVGIDLTDRKLAEDALAQSENKFRALVENVSDVIFTIDLEGHFTYISPSWETVTGYLVADFVGTSKMVLVHPADVDTVVSRMGMLAAGKQHTGSDFYRVRHADGQWHWHAARSVPIIDEAGRMTGVVSVVRDVTQIRENQLLLQSSLEQLEQTLNDKHILLKEIHHRVKNNLQIAASLLSMQAQQLTDKQAKDALKASRDRVITMARLHTMMYQGSSSGDSSDVVVFDAYVYTLLEHIQHAYHASKITFTVSGDSFALSVNQAVSFGLIVNELLTNAVKYAFPTPQEDAHVTVHLAHGQNSITMVVEDNGVGMSPDVDPATSASLGMTIVQSLTTQLKGTVAFHNRKDGRGARIRVARRGHCA